MPTPTTFTYETAEGLAPSGFGVVFTGNPEIAEGWDDWGPFYTQTYGAFFGVDGSTLEMCSNQVCGGRFGSKRAQYIGFYSSAGFWISNRPTILRRPARDLPPGRDRGAEVELLRRRAGRGARVHRDPAQLDGPVPEAFVIPSGASPVGSRSRSRTGSAARPRRTASRDGCSTTAIQLHRTTKDYEYGGQTLAKQSYVVFMDQALRGFAYTALAAGQDISDRITQLYAPPGAWSHGQLWGADTFEVPAGAGFAPPVQPIAHGDPAGRRRA